MPTSRSFTRSTKRPLGAGARAALVGALAGWLCVALGCEALVSVDGLTGADSAGDGSPGGRRSSPGDSGSDSPPIDQDASDSAPPPSVITDASGAPEAAAADAAPTLDAATASPFCATLSPAPLFCDDFDQGALGAPFFQVTSTGGSATLSTGEYVSSPNAMRVAITPNAPSGVDVAGYQRFSSKAGVAATFTFAFDLRVDVADKSSASDAVVAAIQLADNQGRLWDLELELSYSSGALAINFAEDSSTGTPYVSHPTSAKLPLNAWTRVSMKLALGSPGGGTSGNSATLSLAGAQVASEGVNVTAVNGVPEILVGATYAMSSSTGWDLRYDNVTFSAQ